MELACIILLYVAADKARPAVTHRQAPRSETKNAHKQPLKRQF